MAGLEPIEYPGVGVGKVTYRLHPEGPGCLVEEDPSAAELFGFGGVSGRDDQQGDRGVRFDYGVGVFGGFGDGVVGVVHHVDDGVFTAEGHEVGGAERWDCVGAGGRLVAGFRKFSPDWWGVYFLHVMG